MEDREELARLLALKISQAETLLEKLSAFPVLEGKTKLEKKISAELRFLRKMQNPDSKLKPDHINSSNLLSLSAVLGVLERCHDPVGVFHPFPIADSRLRRLEVDVVANGGAVWYKATARNPEALEEISRGRSEHGQKSITHAARLYRHCADKNLHHFKPPKVVFHFANGVGRSLADRVRRSGVEVEGDVVELDSCEEEECSSEEEEEEDAATVVEQGGGGEREQEIDTERLFLDITAMVAYVSSLTNGGAQLHFVRPTFNQQAEWERQRPVKAHLDWLFAGKRLMTCRQAVDSFSDLVETLGGPGEKERAAELMARLSVLDDGPSQRVLDLPLSANISQRSRVIFGTADQQRLLIVTANSGFVRSAKGQGVRIAAQSHEARVLSEAQEIDAVPLAL